MVREMGVTFASFGDLVYEVLTVKAANSFASQTARHVEPAHIGFGDHGFHSGVDVVIGKLSPYVFVEERIEIGKLFGVGSRHGYFSLWGIRVCDFCAPLSNEILCFVVVHVASY
jgi:hypothetical protein